MREVGRAEHASTEQLSALLDGRAESDELVFLAGHVEQCITCSHELADLRAVRDLLRALPVYLPPRSFTIPVEAARPVRRYGVLIPLTRVLGTVAAVLCVVLFSVDAIQTGYEAPTSVPDGSAGSMHITTARSTDADRAEDTASKITNAPAPPAAFSQPAAALAPAATQRPFSTPIQSIATTVPATPAGLAAKPAEPAGAAESAEPARSRAEGIAAAPPPAQRSQAADAPAKPAAAAAPAQPAGGQPKPAAAQAKPADAPAKPAAAAQGQPAAAQQVPGGAAKPQPEAAPPAPQSTTSAFAPGPPASTAAPSQVTGSVPDPAPAQRSSAPTTVASPWLSPIRVWSLGFALVAAALLIASLILSRLSRPRSGPRDEWSRS